VDALLMCGGKGTRLDIDGEKPLYEVETRPMMITVRNALAESTIDTVHTVVSPHVTNTRERATQPIIDAPGDGYVTDLQYALDCVDRPVLTAAADLPLLVAETVDRVVEAHTGGSLTAYVPATLKRHLGVSVDTSERVEGVELAPTGINIVGQRPSHTRTPQRYVTYDTRLAVNVNRHEDARIAEKLSIDES
jgi:adenosylcobinamide-phosphate guanylyltransferase (EC 2.7.7.62)